MRAVTILLFMVGWGLVFYYRSERMAAKVAGGSAEERRWVQVATWVITLHVSLAQLLLTLPIFGLLLEAAPRQRLTLGLATFYVGIVWWLWARRSLGPLDQFLDTVSPPTRLLVDGPFAVVRHPLALGTLLCTLGSAIAAASLATWVSFAGCGVCLAKRCLQDEETLWDVFGAAYGSYAARTSRLLPFLW